MNRSITTTIHYTSQALGVLIVAVVLLFGTLLVEGIAATTHTDRAQAWHCTIDASETTITAGESTTLSWDAADDTDYVTIGAFPGETFAKDGTRDVTPTETTTYTAYTHVGWTDETMQCSVTVTVEAPACEAVLSIDGSSFTWEGCPDMERYQADLCDGTTVGPVYGEWHEDVTIDLGARIAEVRACGEDCHRVATQSCPTPEEPVAPSCPFNADANTVVVNFDGSKLRSDMNGAQAQSGPYSVALDAGTYTVETFSWDGYRGRESMNQPDESWYLEYLHNSSTVVGDSPRTSDLADNVIEAHTSDNFSNVNVNQAADSVRVRHATFSDTSSPNSVVPICAAFTKVEDEEPETLTCDMSASPSTVRKNKNATLTWSSTNAVSATIDQSIGDVSVDGNTTITPSEKTTYTGTFTDADGDTVICNATVSIRTGGGGTPLKPRDDDDEEEEEDEEEDEEPTFVLGKTVNSITLDQVPYTGFEAGPLMTALFWIGLLAVSAVIAQVLTNKRVPERMKALFVAPAVPHAQIRPTVLPSPPAPIVARSVTQRIAPQQGAPLQQHRQDNRNVEDAAHTKNILLSPEAQRHIERAVGETQDGAAFLEALFANTISTYQREDGWILLSDERATTMLERTPRTSNKPVEPTQSNNTAPSTPTRVPSEPHRVESPRMRDLARNVGDELKPSSIPAASTNKSAHETRTTKGAESTDSIVPLFIDLVTAGEQQKTFELLRRLNGQGAETETFIATVIRKLDDIYKHRLEGNHNPDKALAAKTATWSNADFEAVLGILVESVDYSYSSPRIGTKIALAKLFEHFSK